MDCRYFVYLDSQTVERSVKSLEKEFEARNIGAAILKVNSKLKSSSMRAKLHPLSTQPGFISDICCKEESKVPRKSSQQPIWVKDNPHLWWKTEANIYQPRWKQSLLINVAKTSSTYMKIFLVGRIIGVPVKWRTCTLLVSLRLHLGFLSCLIFFYLDELSFSMRRHLFLEDILPVINATITYNKDFMTSCEIFTLVGSRGKFGFLKKVALFIIIVSSDFRDEDVEWKGQQQWLHWHTLRWYNLVIYINWLDEIGYNVAIPL